jgi:FkbM family methyltransferase
MFATVDFILRHPLNSENKLGSLLRFAKWQIGSRIVPGSVVVPFVNSTHLVVRRGMTSATGSVYCGLFELEEMTFVLHALRAEDTFVDVGANIGAYTVLAGGAVECRCISIEPSPETFADLEANIRINGIGSSCRAENVAVGSTHGVLRFTKNLGALNHVISSNETLRNDEITEVPVLTLDEILGDTSPTIIKMDVEGYEKQVINGAGKILANSALQAIIMEINTHEDRYGYEGSALLTAILDYGFKPFRYQPQQRSLVPWIASGRGDNVIFVRDPDWLLDRVKTAPKFEIRRLDVSI